MLFLYIKKLFSIFLDHSAHCGMTALKHEISFSSVFFGLFMALKRHHLEHTSGKLDSIQELSVTQDTIFQYLASGPNLFLICYHTWWHIAILIFDVCAYLCRFPPGLILESDDKRGVRDAALYIASITMICRYICIFFSECSIIQLKCLVYWRCPSFRRLGLLYLP